MSKEESAKLLQLTPLLSPYFFLSKSSRDTSLAETFSARELASFFFMRFAFHFSSCFAITKSGVILSDDSLLTVGTVSGVVSHKSLNNSNVASSFPLFFFSLNLIDLLFIDIVP